MFIKVLSLCAAIFAPESSGQDPHGRSLHLKTHEDFDVAYEACIATAKQARKHRVDPFVSIALAYKETRMSLKYSKRSKAYHDIQHLFGCTEHKEKFIRESCSPFMLTPMYLSDLLNAFEGNYEQALCSFLSSGQRQCSSDSMREARVIKNMAKRFADVYSRTHTNFSWIDPVRVQR